MNALSRRYLSVWLKRLPTDRLARRSSAPDNAPFVVVAPVKAALRIAALNDAAAQLGLKSGMALADARAMYPALASQDADPEADHALLEAIADWSERYTPLVGLDAPDGLVLDVTGCAHLFGGEAALCRNMIERLARQGLQSHVAVADTVGCAWGVARCGQSLPRRGRVGGEADRVGADASPHPGSLHSPTLPLRGGISDHAFIVPRGNAREALSPLPLAALRISSDIIAALAQAGLKCIGDVLDRPRAPLAARFGQDFVRRIDQALGHEDEPITPRLPLPAAMAEQRFPDPIALEADVLGTIEHLAGELDLVLERRGEGARLFQLALFRADGKVHRLEVGTAAPLRDPARIRRLFAERLAVLGDACDPGFGFDMVRLSALATERLDPAQTGLQGADDSAGLAHLIDRLGARFGLHRVCRLMPQNTHIPEFAVAAVPAHALSFSPPPLRRRSMREAHREGGEFASAAFASYPPPRPSPSRGEGEESLAPTRPIRLFARPEPVEAVAEVPDGPPVRFRWRRVLHEVAVSEGPERIAMEWWRDDRGNKLTRDYFRVESKAGARVWLYREGLYGREIAQPRWFLHGLFA
jgi:protein ImuB